MRPQPEAMGVYRLTIPESIQDSLNPKARNGSSSFRTQRPREVCRNNSTVSESDDCSVNSSVFTANSTSTRTTISDCDDSVLMDFASRASSIDDVLFSCAPQVPKRHSTACCTDMAFRREQRKRNFEPPTVDTNNNNNTSSSLAMTLSFRRELDLEDDRVDHSLALWEETPVEHVRPVRNVHPAPHSWHAGDTAASSGSSRNKKKLSKSFFNGLFLGLTSRRSRKSAS